MATVNLNKVICISLKSHSDAQLDAIGATYDISHEYLLKAKSEGCKKVWLHIGGGVVIAGLDTDNMEDVYFSPEYLPMTAKIRKAVLAIKPVKTPKMPTWAKTKSTNVKVANNVEVVEVVETAEVELELDTILDKISASGMASLTKKELEFLKECSK